MSCENLVCASCAGRVVEGRCRVCRSARLELHNQLTPGPLVVAAVLVLLVLLLSLL